MWHGAVAEPAYLRFSKNCHDGRVLSNCRKSLRCVGALISRLTTICKLLTIGRGSNSRNWGGGGSFLLVFCMWQVSHQSGIKTDCSESCLGAVGCQYTIVWEESQFKLSDKTSISTLYIRAGDSRAMKCRYVVSNNAATARSPTQSCRWHLWDELQYQF